MTEYTVTIGFWLRAYDSFTVEADSDAEAIGKAKAAAKTAIESRAHPEHTSISRNGGKASSYAEAMSWGCAAAPCECNARSAHRVVARGEGRSTSVKAARIKKARDDPDRV